MADKTGIEWTDTTWNPIRGCSRVSEGMKAWWGRWVARMLGRTRLVKVACWRCHGARCVWCRQMGYLMKVVD